MEQQLKDKELKDPIYATTIIDVDETKQDNVIRMPRNAEAFAVLGNFVYVVKQGQYVDMTNPKNMYNPKQFNEAFQHIKFSDDRTTPDSFIRKHQTEHRVVTDMVWSQAVIKELWL